MSQLTKKLFFPPLAAFLAGALYFPALAQEKSRNEPVAASVQAGTGGEPAAHKKKPTGKKKIVKKKKAPPPEPASEYKFKSQDSPLSYTFDKKGDPIVKKKSAAAGSSKKAKRSGAAGQPLPKLDEGSPAGKDAQSNRAARYVCPMGEYEGSEPGQCPKCGMTLVKKT